MKLEYITDHEEGPGWYVTGTPKTVGDMGPYETKAEASEDKRGLIKYLKENK